VIVIGGLTSFNRKSAVYFLLGMPVLGDFESRVFGVGPQVGYKFNVDKSTDGYVNLKGYYEFGAKNRPEGWNVWLTVAFSPAAKKSQ
jgi:hypothetical protein